MRKTSLILLLCCLMANMQGIAQSCDTVSLAPDSTQFITDESVTGYRLLNNVLYIAGNFNMVGKPTGNFIGVDKITGRPVNQATWPKIAGTVKVAVQDGNGGFIVGGLFTRVGDSLRSNLVQINSAGQVTSWNPGPNGAVNGAFLADNILYIGGEFGNVFGTIRNRAAAINMTAGTLTTWNPNVNNTIKCVAVYGNTVWLGGSFSNVGGTTRYNLAGVDKTSAAVIPQITGSDGDIYTLAIGNGHLFVGGEFTYAFNAGLDTRKNLYSLNASTGVLDSWICNTNQRVVDLDTMGNNLIVAGRFDTINAVARKYSALVNMTTAAVQTFNANNLSWVYSVAHDNDYVYAAGEAYAANNAILAGVTAFDKTTGVAGAFKSFAPRFAEVNTLIPVGNTIFVGGFLKFIGGEVRKRIAALDLDSNKIKAFAPNPDYNTNTAMDLEVYNNKLYVVSGANSVPGSMNVFDLNTSAAVNFPALYTSGKIDKIRYYNGFMYYAHDGVRRVDPVSGAIDNSWIAAPSSLSIIHPQLEIKNDKIYFADFLNGSGTVLNVYSVTNGSLLNQQGGINTMYEFGLMADRVVVGGSFTSKLTSFYNTAGFSVAPWAPAASSIPYIVSVSPVGSRVFALGLFTAGSGTNTPMVFDTATNQRLFPSWNPQLLYGYNQKIIATGSDEAFVVSINDNEKLIEDRPLYGMLRFKLTGYTPFTASVSAAATNVCPGQNVSLTATPAVLPATYQWKKNGTNISGATNSSYTGTAANNDQFSCVVTYSGTSTNSCIGNSVAYSNTVTITTGNVTPAISIAATANTLLCSGVSTTFSATSNITGGTYQWKKNNINVGLNSATYTYTSVAGDVITCERTVSTPNTCYNASSAVSNAITISSVVSPVVTIAATPGNSVCPGSSVTFNATVTGSGTPTYQWKKNNLNIGTNSPAYTDASPVNNDVYSCVISYSTGCFLSVTSNSITMAVSPPVTPSVSIATTQTNICQGSPITFTATAVNPGAVPIYQWKKNNLNTGTNANTYSDGLLANNDVISCTLTSSLGCVTGNTAASNNITMTVTDTVNPSVTILASQTLLCQGTSVTLTASGVNGGPAPVYAWKKNGNPAGSNSNVYTDAALANNDVVTCELTSNAICATPATATANAVTFTVNPSYTQSVSESICAGASYTFGTQVLTAAGIYTQTFTLGTNCDSTVTLNLTVNTVDAGVTQSGSMLTATATGTYQWLNCSNNTPVAGATGKSFTPAATGSYKVAVVVNGCTDTSGCYSVNITGIDQPDFAKSISIFPNPAQNDLYVTYDKSLPADQILITDLAGRMLQTVAIKDRSGKVVIHLGQIRSGMYLLKILVKNEVAAFKFVKQ
jgi:hypothetical protein